MVSVAFAIRPPSSRTVDVGQLGGPRGPNAAPFPPIDAASDVPVCEAPAAGALASILHRLKAGTVYMMSMLYQAYQNHMDLMAPWRSGAASALGISIWCPAASRTASCARLSAALELISRSTLTYARPAYDIDRVHGRQPGVGGDRGGGLCDAVRLAAALQEARHARSSRRCCWWRRCPAISRRCCAAR